MQRTRFSPIRKIVRQPTAEPDKYQYRENSAGETIPHVYYQITWRQLPVGTAVQPFAWSTTPSETAARQQLVTHWERSGESPWPREPTGSCRAIDAKIPPHERALLAEFASPGVITGIRLRTDHPEQLQRLYDRGAREVHMRPACPPLVFGCPFLNFSRSRSVLDLAARRAAKELGEGDQHLHEYANPDSERHRLMVERIRQRLGLTSLKYQRLNDLVSAIGLPQEKLCTYCWDGTERCAKCPAHEVVATHKKQLVL
ncbi:MAG: hypothetical protein ACYC3X_16415 [Pirellulaceae bacterium]